MSTEKKGVRLEHISKIYQDQKTGKDLALLAAERPLFCA